MANWPTRSPWYMECWTIYIVVGHESNSSWWWWNHKYLVFTSKQFHDVRFSGITQLENRKRNTNILDIYVFLLFKEKADITNTSRWPFCTIYTILPMPINIINCTNRSSSVDKYYRAKVRKNTYDLRSPQLLVECWYFYIAIYKKNSILRFDSHFCLDFDSPRFPNWLFKSLLLFI